ncbi:DUF6644 family protein [Brevundimonas sp. GN22]
MLGSLADWISTTAVGQTVANVLWLIPALQSVHILAMGTLLMSATLISLRLMEVVGKDRSVEWYAERFLSWIWWPLAVLVVTGLLLISGEPARALLNLVFQLKMGLLLLVVILTVTVARVVKTNAGQWTLATSSQAKLFGLLTLILWVAIVVAGRLIAYVE